MFKFYLINKLFIGLPVFLDSLRAIAIRCLYAVDFGNPFLLKHLPVWSQTLKPFPVASIEYGIIYCSQINNPIQNK
jgi:hypothetical protein